MIPAPLGMNEGTALHLPLPPARSGSRLQPQQHVEGGQEAATGGAEGAGWQSREKQKAFLDAFAERNGIKDAEGWKRVKQKDVLEAGGSGVLRQHGESLGRALSELYEDLDGTLCVSRKPRGYWREAKNQREFLEEFARERGIEKAEEWKAVTSKDLVEAGGAAILKAHASVYQMLRSVFPERNFVQQECRPAVDAAYWDVAENRREFMERVARKNGVKEKSDWKDVGYTGVAKEGGRRLLDRYGSFYGLLSDVFPEMELTAEDCYAKLPQGFWEDAERKREFLDTMAKRRNVRRAEEWSRVTFQDVRDAGGSGLLSQYGGSLFAALVDVYGGEYEGESLSVFTCRAKAPQEFWAKEENVREFLERVKQQCGIEKDEDWSRVSVSQIKDMRGSGLLQRHSLREALAVAYPTTRWSQIDFSGPKAKKSAQRNLYQQLDALFAIQQERGGDGERASALH